MLSYYGREVDIKELSLRPIGEDNHLGARVAENGRVSGLAYRLLVESGQRLDLAPRALLLDGTSNLRSHEAEGLLEDLIGWQKGEDCEDGTRHIGRTYWQKIIGEHASQTIRIHDDDHSSRRWGHTLYCQPSPPGADDVSIAEKWLALTMILSSELLDSGILHSLKV